MLFEIGTSIKTWSAVLAFALASSGSPGDNRLDGASESAAAAQTKSTVRARGARKEALGRVSPESFLARRSAHCEWECEQVMPLLRRCLSISCCPAGPCKHPGYGRTVRCRLSQWHVSSIYPRSLMRWLAGVPPFDSSNGAGGVLLDRLHLGAEHRRDSVSVPRARTTLSFFAFERLESIPLRAGA